MRTKIQNTRALVEAISGTEIYSCKENGPIFRIAYRYDNWLTAQPEPVDVAEAANTKM